MDIHDIVMVFEDPITKIKPEGKAEIISVSLHDVSNPKMIGYSCDVKFLSDGFECRRTIYREAI